jgi:hypothetical protein
MIRFTGFRKTKKIPAISLREILSLSRQEKEMSQKYNTRKRSLKL